MGSVKVSDYIVRRIADLGVTHVFLVTGGGAMHLDDSVGNEPRLEYVCCHHEQACAVAVEGYARTRGAIGCAVVTTGPGGTNTVTGVLGQWHDSVPALYVSGQVRLDTTVASTGLPLRQLGDQEADIISIVRPITKYAVMVTDPATIRYHFDRSVHLATTGRPGPVWLDVPLNVQGAYVEEDELVAYDPREDADEGAFDQAAVRAGVVELVQRIRATQRPVILAGNGIRAGGAIDIFREVIDLLGIPVVTAWNAADTMYEDHPLYIGRSSSVGDRAGNFAVQNADLLVSVACRLNVRQIGYEFAAFARDAFRVVVDIDEAELNKPTIFPHMRVHSDVRFFLDAMRDVLGGEALPPKADWLDWCRERRRRYPIVLPAYRSKHGCVDNYVFVDTVSRMLDDDEVIVLANGSACIIGSQATVMKQRSRLIENSGTAAMGYDLPAAVGACFANRKRRVVCFSGDGSIMMNLQELQTIAHHGLPVKIFVFNNRGYVSIRQTQDNIFSGHHVGEGPETGVSFPDFVKVAKVFGLEATRIHDHDEMVSVARWALDRPGPVLCDVMIDPGQTFMPKVMAEKLPDGTIVSKPLEDMYPFLDRDEFRHNMLVPAWQPGR